MKPVFLIGCMGSGKTTLGSALQRAVMPDGTTPTFVDLDAAIEQREGMSVGEIFRQKGEQYFRDLETSVLRHIGLQPGIIVACGGGTPCHDDNMQWMNAHGLTVLLQASTPTLKRRLIEGAGSRPLLASLTEESLERFIVEKQSERRPYYSQAALTFPSDLLETEEEIKRSRTAFLQLIANHI